MSYKHILVAVDLTKSSEIVIRKAVSLAKEASAKLSFIYVDTNISEQVDTLGLAKATGSKEKQRLQKELYALADQLDYPVDSTLVVIGDVEVKLATAVNQFDADLLVCGHHHNFWSRLLSSVRNLVNTVSTDLLIVYIEK